MKKNSIVKSDLNKSVFRDEVLKATALLYLKEALVRERYEDCAELIRIAKGFGAVQAEVSGVLAEHNRGTGAARVSEAKQDLGGRLRFY